MSVRTYDEGVYVCKASNTLGQSQSSAALRVAGNLPNNTLQDNALAMLIVISYTV